MAEMPGMGWVPDIPDIRDYTEELPAVAEQLSKTALAYRVHAPRPDQGAGGKAARGSLAVAAAAPAPAQIPTAVDLRPWCSPVEDQKTIGSCTANAAVGMIEYFERKALGKHVDGSRLFVYKTTRDLLGWTGDRGAYLRSAMGALVLFGVPPESYWPYDVAKFDIEPSAFLYALGQNYKSLQYFRIDPSGTTPDGVLANVKSYLAGGFPSIFGFPVYGEFMNVGKDGLVAMPQQNSKLYGGHAILAVGYDDSIKIGGDTGALLIRNSWGTTWGLAGYAWLSYKYVTAGLAVDWWTNVKCEWVDNGQFL